MELHAAQHVFKLHFPAYQAILDGDYLQHSVLYNALLRELPKLPTYRPGLRLLDLGCGDAAPLCSALQSGGLALLPAQYTGVDMSAPALRLAAENVRRCVGGSCKLSFVESDMLSFLCSSECQASYDVVLASFSIHHLQADEKLKLLQRLFQLLKPCKGALVMIDVLRFPGESVSGYRDRICDDARKHWSLMAPDDRETFISHMQNFDFPASLAEFQDMARQAGFESTSVKCAASKALGNLVIFQA